MILHYGQQQGLGPETDMGVAWIRMLMANTAVRADCNLEES